MEANRSTLYVGDLPFNCQTADLYAFFERYGTLVKVKLIDHDRGTKRPHARITFEKEEEGVSAMEDLTQRCARLNGSYIHVMYSNPRAAQATNCNVFFKNLNTELHANALRKYCQQFGGITSAKIGYEDVGGRQVHRGHGFVQFDSEEAAQWCIDAVAKAEEAVLQSPGLTAEFFIPHQDRLQTQGYTNLYVRGFDESFTEEQLAAVFEPFGLVTSCMVMRDSAGVSKRFGFVAYAEPQQAVLAVTNLHKVTTADGITWHVGRAQSKFERAQENLNRLRQKEDDWKSRNLYVRPLDESITEDMLRSVFTPYGNIESVRISCKQSICFDEHSVKQTVTQSRGFGYVCFERPEDANRAIAGMDKQILQEKQVRVTKWLPREDVEEKKKGFKARRSQYQQSGMRPGVPQAPRYVGRPGRYQQIPQPGYMPPVQPQPGHVPMPQPGYMTMPQPGYTPMPQAHYYPMMPTQPHMQPIDSAASPGAHIVGPATTPPAAPAPQRVRPTAQEVKQASPENWREAIGDYIYHKIEPTYGDFTGKVTGLMISLPREQLESLLDDERLLLLRCKEANAVMKEKMASADANPKEETKVARK